ncbi:hypothetical protein B0H10DRAFT_2039665 [Mycena sp. CBHHK59/15]|nr:hypothetical protein B0H10DRAFT_2039665 [Mycena sp. CBHHK59/15]
MGPECRTFAFRRGAPNRQSYVLCFAGFYLCVVFYALSKFLVYVFLTEKVHTVCGNSARRLNSPVSTLCLGTLCSYITAGELRVIDLVVLASLACNLLDLCPCFLAIYSPFLWPLLPSQAPATRTLINIAILTTLKGQELGWVCLGSFGADIMIIVFRR